jgi:hypothetical protein
MPRSLMRNGSPGRNPSLLDPQNHARMQRLRAPVPVLSQNEMTVLRDFRQEAERRAAAARGILECIGKTGEREFGARIQRRYLAELEPRAIGDATHLFHQVVVVPLDERNECLDIREYLLPANSTHVLPQVHVETHIVVDKLSNLLTVPPSDLPGTTFELQYRYGHRFLLD